MFNIEHGSYSEELVLGVEGHWIHHHEETGYHVYIETILQELDGKERYRPRQCSGLCVELEYHYLVHDVSN